MRAETEALASDLSDLLRLRRSIAAERDSLADDVTRLGVDRQRLAALIDARQSALASAEQALGGRARSRRRSRQAGGQSQRSYRPNGIGSRRRGPWRRGRSHGRRGAKGRRSRKPARSETQTGYGPVSGSRAISASDRFSPIPKGCCRCRSPARFSAALALQTGSAAPKKACSSPPGRRLSSPLPAMAGRLMLGHIAPMANF